MGRKSEQQHAGTSGGAAGVRPKEAHWAPDLLASLVVFLVALPLCIGIAVACGVPAERGLVSGIVGGLVVGVFAGAPLLVTGPAASLIVPVFDLVQRHGLAALGPVVILAGLFQIFAGLIGLGQWFRAVAPAVIVGMLVGIGILIFASQLHVAVDSDPRSSFVLNVISFPGVVTSHLSGAWPGLWAVAVGVSTIGLLVTWNRVRPRSLNLVPGHLVALVLVTLVTFLLDLPVRFLDISPSFVAALDPVGPRDLSRLLSLDLVGKSLIFAFVASAATLLTASAIDQRQSHSETDYNREMVAQGLGNVVTGGLGGLPMTGVIVRSSVNVDAGARTRASAILHGVWIFVFVLVMPEVLERIPRSALGAILVYTGYKLIDVRALQALYRQGRAELAIALITLFGVVFVELFVGVVAGLAAAIIKLVYTFSHLEIQSEMSPTEKVQHLQLAGAATFVRLPQLAEALEKLPSDRRIVVHIDRLDHIDHACLELLSSFKQRREAKGAGEVVVEWDELTHRYHNAVLGAGFRPSGPSPSLLSLVWKEWKRVYGLEARPQEEESDARSWFQVGHIRVNQPHQSLKEVLTQAGRILAREVDSAPAELTARLEARADSHMLLGQGICIPHVAVASAERSHLACIVTGQSVSLFGDQADIFFVLVASEADPEQHLHALAHVGGLCHDAQLLEELRSSTSDEEAAALLLDAERRSQDRVETSGRRDRRLAVLELGEAANAERVRELLSAAFPEPVTQVGARSELFDFLRPLIGAAPDTELLAQTLSPADLGVLRALLEEQERLFPGVQCRLHVLQPEPSFRPRVASGPVEASVARGGTRSG